MCKYLLLSFYSYFNFVVFNKHSSFIFPWDTNKSFLFFFIEITFQLIFNRKQTLFLVTSVRFNRLGELFACIFDCELFFKFSEHFICRFLTLIDVIIQFAIQIEIYFESFCVVNIIISWEERANAINVSSFFFLSGINFIGIGYTLVAMDTIHKCIKVLVCSPAIIII